MFSLKKTLLFRTHLKLIFLCFLLLIIKTGINCPTQADLRNTASQRLAAQFSEPANPSEALGGTIRGASATNAR